MPDQQSVNTVAAPSAPTTPEQAKGIIAERNTDREWSAKLLSGDLAIKRENDRLLEIAAGMPAREQPSLITTPEQAKGRLDELNTNADWRKKFLTGDLSARKEFDRLTEIAASVPEGTAIAAKAPTAAQARAAALDEVPAEPAGYTALPFRHDDRPSAEGTAEIQGLIHAAGLTRSEANTMVSFAANDLVKWGQMDEVARAHHLNDTVARFRALHGEQAPAMEAGARRLVAEIDAKQGGRLREILMTSGAGASLGVWNAIATAAKRRYGK